MQPKVEKENLLDTLAEVLTMEDIARYLRISRSAAYELPHLPGFPAIRLGRTIRVIREPFLKWLEERQEKS